MFQAALVDQHHAGDGEQGHLGGLAPVRCSRLVAAARRFASHRELLVDLAQSCVQLPVAYDVVVDDVIAQCGSQSAALRENIVDAAPDDGDRTTDVPLLRGGKCGGERMSKDNLQIGLEFKQQCRVAEQGEGASRIVLMRDSLISARSRDNVWTSRVPPVREK